MSGKEQTYEVQEDDLIVFTKEQWWSVENTEVCTGIGARATIVVEQQDEDGNLTFLGLFLHDHHRELDHWGNVLHVTPEDVEWTQSYAGTDLRVYMRTMTRKITLTEKDD